MHTTESALSAPVAEPAPEAQTPVAPPKISRAAQSIALQDDVTRAYRMLNLVSTTASLKTELAEYGYHDEALADGIKLIQAAATALGIRFETLGTRGLDQGEFMTALKKAGNAYKKYRKIVRACFPEREDRVALTAAGDAPRNLDLLVAQAQSGYNNAAKEPWAGKLAQRGYPKTKLKTLVAEVDALVEAASKAAGARGDAIAATAERNAACEALNAYMREFKGVARAALEDVPGALNTLGL